MKKEIDQKTVSVLHIRVPKNLKEKIEKVSKTTDISVNAIVLNCLAERYSNVLTEENHNG